MTFPSETHSYIYIYALARYIFTVAFIYAQQLARCWTRNCCRWPRCWTRRQMNLRSPQETRSSHTPSLIYWSHLKHPPLLSKLWAFLIFPFILYLSLSISLSLFLSSFLLLLLRTRVHHDLRRWLSVSLLFVFVVMALGAATVRQAGDELVVNKGAQLVWFPSLSFSFFFLLAFSLHFTVKIRLVLLDLRRPGLTFIITWSRVVACFPCSRCGRPSCAVTWRVSSKIISRN